MRILLWVGFFFASFPSWASKYYVDASSGSDANSPTQAQLPGSAWQNLSFALANAAVVNGDSIVVLPGTYTETNLVITKKVKIFGNETGGVPGVGTKPVFSGTSATTGASVFVLQSSEVRIQNLEIRVNQTDVIRGIFCNGGGYNLLEILDNHIFSAFTGTPSVFNSYGIQLGTTSIQAAATDSFIIARNIIRPLTAGSAMFGRGIRLVGGFGKVGGELAADSNQIMGDYGIQAGDIRRTIKILNNHLFGRSAAIEVNIPAANRRHLFTGNKLSPAPGAFPTLSLIEIKNNINANSVIEISGNQFVGHQIFGILSTRSNNVLVKGNTFIPSDTSRLYTHIAVNTKQQTTGTDASRASSITIVGNDFQGNGLGLGTGIAFQNHNSGVNPAFINTTIGGPGTDANNFASSLGRYLMLDTASGLSTNIPLWNQTGYKTTQMRPVSQSFDLQNNLFDLGSGAGFPASKTNAELLALENKILHAIDYDSLGFVTVKPNHAFVTTQSFIQPLNAAPALARALRVIGSADDWTLGIEPGTYPDKAMISSNLTIVGNGSNTPVIAPILEMNGAGKTLNLQVDFYVSDSLKLTAGNIAQGVDDIQILNGADLGGGSAGSFVTSSGTGLLVYESLGATAVKFPLGTAQGYFPLTVSNSGSADAIGFRVANDVLSNGLTGTSVDSVVNATWVVNEGTVGGSNLNIVASWPGVGEKPFFARTETVLQGFSGGAWSNVSTGTVAAVGADPYSATYTNVTSDLASLPLRIRTTGEPEIPGRLYYVDDNTGLDSRTNNEAKNPNTPWKTIANAIAKTIAGDSIQVLAGTYTEFDLLVNKSLTILGNVTGVGVGVGAGTGVKPVVNGIGPSPLDSSIFIVRATNVNIRNFNIKVDIDKIKYGINAPVTGFGGLVIEDNLIESTAEFVTGGIDVVVLSHAILLGRLIGANGNGNDSIIVRRNVINREGPTKKWFSRGIRWWGGRGMVGGNAPADGNEVHADFAIQLAGGNTGGRLQTRNNLVFGRAAGVEYNTPPPTFIHTIANNTIRPMDNSGHFALVEIKSNIRVTGPTAPAPPFIDIENNTLTDFYNIGVAITRSRNCRVLNNIFTPRADSVNYRHIWVNSKQRTAGSAASQPPLSSVETFIQGNTFNGNNVSGGYGVAFQNANRHSSGKVFTINAMGGVGALANTFGANIAKVVYLDTITGPSSDDAFWSKPGVNWVAWPSTPTGPVIDNFDFSENLYDLGTGPKRPAAMTNSELLELEDKVVHKIEADTLGFVTMKPNHVFVTQQSFVAPLTTTARLQRGVNAAGAVDGVTVNIEAGPYNGNTTVAQSLIFDATPDGEVISSDLGMNGSGKILTLANNFKILSTLRLTDGLIDLGSSDLTLAETATIAGGSLSSHVQTNGTGSFVHENVATTLRDYPVGTGSRYAFTQISNSGTADNIGLRVKNDVLANGLSGAVQDTVVDITYQIRETTPGASNLVFQPSWTAANERPIFDRNQIFVEAHNGTNWINIGPTTPAVATGTDPFTASVQIAGTWAEQPIRVIGRAVPEPIGNLYYVDDETGLDSRTNAEARNPNTPWRTIANALAKTIDGDSIQVFQGTYNEANLRVTKALKLFGNVIGVGTGVGAGTGIRPVVNGSALAADSSIFTIQSDDVLLNNFQLEVDQALIINGVLAKTANYDRLRLLNNRILSVGVNTAPPLPCLRFNTYGIRLVGFGTDSLLIQGNEIEPSLLDGTRCVFGRGIKLFGGHGLIGGPNDLDSNRILAYYDIQAGDIDGGRLIIENNFTIGIGVQIVAPAANSGIHEVRNNNLFLAFPDQFPNIVELKDIQKAGTGVLVTGNNIAGYTNVGVFSQRNQNVSIVGNNFIPLPSATSFRHIVVNTKQETIAAIQNPVPSSILIQSNNFGAGSTQGSGTALEFGNHNDDPASTDAFTNVIIGGPGALANNFAAGIGKFLVLDPLSGLSTSVPFWASYPATPMRPVADNFDIRNNFFGVSGGLKLPTTMTDDEHYEMEDKVVHGIDYDSLGFVTWKPEFAYVTDNSFLAPFTSTPSIQRAVKASGVNDTWQVNIQPIEISETVTVPNSMIWNTYPRDTMRLGGISMNGLGKTLTLTDRFILTNALTLNNANGGLINAGSNDLVVLPTTTVTAGSISSYVVSNGTGGLVRRGVDDLSYIFPVGTADSYAPVNFDDENNTGDNFKVTVRAANTQADFTPPLPATIDSHVKFEWSICEDVAGGSDAQLVFDWVDPSNVNGSGILNGISRNDGTNWVAVPATIGPGLVASAYNFSQFCSPFTVIADPTLTTITTQNIIKIQPGVTGRFCVGDSIRIPFEVVGTSIVPGNAFNAFLSDADGTFPQTGGVLIGSLLGVNSGTVIGVIPVATPPGLNYRIRIVSTNNPITGSATPDSIKIFGLPVRPEITTGDSSICQGETTTLTSSAAQSYVWNPGAAITQSISVSSAGAFTVTITDQNGCKNTSAVRNVSLLATPVAEAITANGALTRCAGDSVTLTANPAGLNYLWLNTTPAVTTRNLVVKTGGSWQVIVSNAAGCADTSVATTTVFNSNPSAPLVTLVSANDTVCQPGTLEFSTPAGFQYEWVVTNVTPNPTTPSVTFTSPAAYSGTVTITDANGCKAVSSPFNGLIKQAPVAPSISALNADLSICEGDTIKLQALPFTSANTYTWQPGNVVASVFQLTAPGQVSVSLAVDSNGCRTTALANVPTNINPAPTQPVVTVVGGLPTSFCAGDSITLISTVGTSYIWSPGNLAGQQIVVKTGGNYSVVTLSDSGCSSAASNAVLVDVKQNPVAPTITATDTEFCNGQNGVLSVSDPVAGNTYTWLPAGSGIGNQIEVTNAGDYSVRVDSTNGCFATSNTITVIVNPLPEPVITSGANGTEVCQGDVVALISNFATGNEWSTGETGISILITQSTPAITLTVTDANGCSNTAGPVAVVVNPLPVVQMLPDTAIVFGEDVELLAVTANPGSVFSYNWATGTTTLGSTTVPTLTVSPEQSAFYRVLVIDTNNCSSRDSVLVRVSREVYVPNMFSPNDDGQNDAFKVYGFGVASIEVKVFDRLGNLVFESNRVDEIVETSQDDNSVKGWDGKYKGEALGQESFIWSVKGKLTTGEDIKVRGGNNSGSVIIMN